MPILGPRQTATTPGVNTGGSPPPEGTVPVQQGNQTVWLPPDQANAHNQRQYDNAASMEFPNGQRNPFLPADGPTQFSVPGEGKNPFEDVDLSGGGGGGGGGGFSPFEYAAFQGARFHSNPWDSPEMLESYGQFKAPSMADLANDPGYQFRLKEGEQALERSAAARGTLLTGGTAKDLQKYGQDMASQEYDKQYGRSFNEWQAETNRRFSENEQTWNRSLQEYQLNYNRMFGEHQMNYDASLQEYQMGYQHAKDNWTAEQSASQQAAASSAAANERARQEKIDLLRQLAGL